MTEGKVPLLGRNTLPSHRLIRGQLGAALIGAAGVVRIITVATARPFVPVTACTWTRLASDR